MFENLLIEKYRPQKLSDIILSEDNQQLLTEYKNKQEISHLIFLGSPGIGKTSLAKIVVSDILDCQYLYLNASDENGIDTIRNKVINFALTKSFDGKIKAVILDEADSLSAEAQRALRNVMEQYAAYCRFILTGNYKYKIIPAVLSRATSLDLTPPLPKVMHRCVSILKAEGITLPEAQKSKFVQLIRNNYPDIRKCINDIQRYSVGGVISIPEVQNEKFYTVLYELIKQKNTTNIRKHIINSEQQIFSDYPNMLRGLFNYIDKIEADEAKKKIFLLVIAEHLYRGCFVHDQEINAYSCCVTLSTS